jgi:hypothetical protein
MGPDGGAVAGTKAGGPSRAAISEAARRLLVAARRGRQVIAAVRDPESAIRQRDDLRLKLANVRRENANLRELRREDRERAAAMVAELDRLRGQGPSGPAPEDARLGHLFIVTYGRSGSTLLQGVLCSQPGFLIRGENGGILEQLFRFHQRAMREREAHRGEVPTTPRSPWHGIDGYPPDLAIAAIRSLVTQTLLRPAPDTRVVGFKEIRWPSRDLPAFLDFIQELFPDARFVVNTRDLDAVARSGFWANRPDARATVEAAEARLLAATDALGDRAYRVHYDDYVADPASLEGLFAWLGEEFDLERVRVVMSRRHSYDPARAAASA